MRRVIPCFLLLLVLIGCGSDTGFYDKQAKGEALQAAKKDPFNGSGNVVSVGSARERDECPQGPSAKAGPCLDVTVTTEVPVRDVSGKLDSSGRKVRATFDVFVWLRKRETGRWEVTHTTYRPKGTAVDGQG